MGINLENNKNLTIFVVNLISKNMRLKNETTKEIVNTETGEVFLQTTSKTFNIKVTSDSFYITFLTVIKELAGLKSIVDVKVLSCLCSIAEYNTGIVFLTAERKQYICDTMNLKYQSVANSLTNLKKSGFITGKGGTYTINPEYFWKGDLKTREQLLKEGKININIEFEDEK
jgi:hypothetical protein